MKATTSHVLALTTTVDEVTGEVKPLFAFPVDVCKATAAEADVKIDAAGPSGAEYTTMYRDDGTGEFFEYGERKRGLRVGDEFREIPTEALDEVNAATAVKTMVVKGQAPLADMLARYGHRVSGVYFMQSPPKGGSAVGYRLVYEGLREVRKGKKVVRPAKALVTKRTARTRQKQAFIYADENLGCLVLCEVAFAASMREPDAAILAPSTVDVPADKIEVARQVIDTKLGDGIAVLDEEVDEAVALKRDLMEQALAGDAIVAPTAIGGEATVADPTDALMASLAA